MSTSDNVFELQFQLGLGVHYHMRRQAFFEKWHRLTSSLSLIFSTSAIAVITSKLEVGIACTAVVATLQAIDLIVDTRGQSNLHSELRGKYLLLERSLIEAGSDISDEQEKRIRMEIKSIEMHEPPIKKLLLEICHNDVCRRLGVATEQLFKIHWFKSSTANVFGWSSSIQ